MKIKSIHARWLHVPIPYEKQHVSDFGRVASFDSVLVRVETECGLIGWGEAKRFVATGPNRISELAGAWRDYVDELEVDDSLEVPGSGPIAFGAIAFADDSASESTLLMPRVVSSAALNALIAIGTDCTLSVRR